jgi:hypothetical protein
VVKSCLKDRGQSRTRCTRPAFPLWRCPCHAMLRSSSQARMPDADAILRIIVLYTDWGYVHVSLPAATLYVSIHSAAQARSAPLDRKLMSTLD